MLLIRRHIRPYRTLGVSQVGLKADWQYMDRLPISVILLTLNEQYYLPGLLENVQPWAEQVFIVDSLSTDRTVDIALEHGATVVQRRFTNFGDQWNWALKHLPIKTPWTMKLDPDERIPPPLRDEFAQVVHAADGCEGYRFRRRLWFMGQPLHQKAWVLRLWRTGRCRFSDVLVNEHPIIDGRVGNLHGVMEHLDSPHLHHWFDKQNLYSTMRALELARGGGFAASPRLFSRDLLQRRMFLKRLFFHLPMRHVLMWWYLALVRGAIFDGRAGRTWVSMRVQVYRWAEHKALEMRRTGVLPSLTGRGEGRMHPAIAATDLQQQVQDSEPSPVASATAEASSPSSAEAPAFAFAGRARERKLRVAVNAVSLAPGGGMVVLLGYLRGWQELGMPVELAVYASRSPVRDRLAEQFPDIKTVPFAVNMSSMRHFVLQQFKLGSLITAQGSDVVFTTNALLGRCEVPQLVLHQNLKRFVTGRFSVQLRRGGPDEAIRDLAARHALRHARINAFISRYLKEEAERIVPASLPRNHVVYNGVPASLIEQARHARDEPPVTGQLIALQSPAEHKDTATLLHTLARLVQRRPEVDWRLKLAGGGNWSDHDRLAQRLGIGSRIDYLGHLDHDQLAPLLRRSLCLVFTSRLEGFGLPPIEAMAHRCPSISCRATAVPEVVGDAGILVEPGDAGAFADAVLQLHDDPARRDWYIRRGVERIAQFSWAASAEKMTGLLEQVARVSPTPSEPSADHETAHPVLSQR